MKKLVLLLFALLLLFSGCVSNTYTAAEYERMQESLMNEYIEMENAYNDASYKIEELYDSFSDIYNEFLTVESYFDGHDDCTEKQARDSVEKICAVFTELGY